VRDLGVHLLLFLLVSTVIVAMSAFFSEPHDGAALRSLPRRLLVFAVGCAILAGVMLLVEGTFAAVR
jgi:hypothetical protein